MSDSSVLKVICADLPAPPLFWREGETRFGYESDVARAIAAKLGLECEFVYQQWGDFYPSLNENKGDILLCGQGISEYRKTLADFTAPYGVFDEAVMVLTDSPYKSLEDLKGKRVGAIANSMNMTLVETFDDVIAVPFVGTTDDIMGEMVAALRAGEVDAFVDDDVALVPLADEADLAIVYTAPTQNKWGIAVSKERPETLAKVDAALKELKDDGTLKAIWQQWMPNLQYPFEHDTVNLA